MSMYGDYVVRTVSQGAAPVVVAQWQPLVSVAGAGPLTDRRYVRFMIRGNRGHTVALQYVAKAADGTFTAPAANTNIKLSTSFPGGSTWVEPIGDNIQVYGRMDLKAGATGNSVRVIVTEYR